MKKIQLQLDNIHCASCVHHIESSLKKLKGFQDLSVNFATSSAEVNFDEAVVSEEEILKTLQKLGYPGHLSEGNTEKLVESKTKRESSILIFRMWLSILLSIPLLLEMIFGWTPWAFSIPGWVQFSLATIVQFVGGWPFYVGTFRSLGHFSANMDVLVALGTSAAYFFSAWTLFVEHERGLYFETSAVLIALILVGRWMEVSSKLKAQSGMKALLQMQPNIARVYRDGNFVEVSIEEVKIGEEIEVRPSQRVPVDGFVLRGSSHVDESMLTGESAAVSKEEGDPVFAGTLNGKGLLILKVNKEASNSSLQHIIQLVENAQLTKAPVQRVAEGVLHNPLEKRSPWA